MISGGPPGPDGDYSFRHMLIRDVVYGRLLYAQRRQLHRRAAEHYEPELGHCRTGRPPGLSLGRRRRAGSSDRPS